MRVFPTGSPSGPSSRTQRPFEEQERAFFSSTSPVSSSSSPRTDTRSPQAWPADHDPRSQSYGYTSSPRHPVTNGDSSSTPRSSRTSDRQPNAYLREGRSSSPYHANHPNDTQSRSTSTTPPGSNGSGHFGVLIMPPNSSQRQREDNSQMKFIALDSKETGAPTRGPARWPRK
jgi:hypothetical protein